MTRAQQNRERLQDKALAMRLIQDAITGFGVNTLWIYHIRTGLDAQMANARQAR